MKLCLVEYMHHSGRSACMALPLSFDCNLSNSCRAVAGHAAGIVQVLTLAQEHMSVLCWLRPFHLPSVFGCSVAAC